MTSNGILNVRFRRSSKDYIQLNREGNIAMYLVRDGNKEYYEVFIVQVRRYTSNRYKGMKTTTNKEVYPSASLFGRTAYCCSDKPTAEFKFKELIKRAELRKGKIPVSTL